MASPSIWRGPALPEQCEAGEGHPRLGGVLGAPGRRRRCDVSSGALAALPLGMSFAGLQKRRYFRPAVASGP
jgi:hypothetical protein